MKDPKGRKIIGFDKHVFVCENVREENHPRKCCSSKTNSNIKILFKKEWFFAYYFERFIYKRY